MNVVFSFNKYKNTFFSNLAAGFRPKNLAVARKIMALPELGEAAAPRTLARTPMFEYTCALYRENTIT